MITVCPLKLLHYYICFIILQLANGRPPSPPIPSSDEGSNQEEEEETFQSLLDSFSYQWLNTQLTHQVSLAAANSVWKTSLEYVGKIFELKSKERVKKNIQQFPQIRKNIYRDICPPVKMTFVFLNKMDNSIVEVTDDHTPLNQFQRNPDYQKLYEEAHIEVKRIIINYLHDIKISSFLPLYGIINVFLKKKV